MSNPLYAFPAVCEQTLRALARYPSRTAFAWPGGSLSYQGATDLIGRMQGVFMRLGFAPGTRVALLTANRADSWCAGVAAQLSRLAITWLHPLGSLDDQLFQIEDSEAQMLIVDGITFRDRGGELATKAQGLKTVFTLGPADYGRRPVAGGRGCRQREREELRPRGRHLDLELHRRHDRQIQGRAALITANMAASPPPSSPISRSRRRRATSRWRRSAMSPAPRCCRR
ncbi:AMP-binding protein [Bradyrhizobium elkanii]|nr:AMP-binding protein [Bradyrhizobium elkanii]